MRRVSALFGLNAWFSKESRGYFDISRLTSAALNRKYICRCVVSGERPRVFRIALFLGISSNSPFWLLQFSLSLEFLLLFFFFSQMNVQWRRLHWCVSYESRTQWYLINRVRCHSSSFFISLHFSPFFLRLHYSTNACFLFTRWKCIYKWVNKHILFLFRQFSFVLDVYLQIFYTHLLNENSRNCDKNSPSKYVTANKWSSTLFIRFFFIIFF